MATRQEYVENYCAGEISFAHIEKKAPFLATQMKLQGYDDLDVIRRVMSYAG
jgi:hypothetical protein